MRSVLNADRLLMRGLTMVVLSIVFFTLFGGILGSMIGLLFPDSFVVFAAASGKPGVTPWKLAATYGVFRGLIAGTVVGCSVLIATAWYKSRMGTAMIESLAQVHALQVANSNPKDN